ncbi:hypothetical protein KHA80_18965 [Anaerobacillus sp. HL2]|nr:hypothetical protein KHA80_18965 [Anaerobacillus sp. HL2]
MKLERKNNLNELLWDDETATVAYLHSQDMQENDYFSHTSPIQGELKDRLKTRSSISTCWGKYCC